MLSANVFESYNCALDAALRSYDFIEFTLQSSVGASSQRAPSVHEIMWEQTEGLSINEVSPRTSITV